MRADKPETKTAPVFPGSALWPILVSVLCFVTASTLQATMVSHHFAQAGAGTDIVGTVAAIYFGGFVLSALYTPRLIHKAGFSRCFTVAVTISALALALYPVSDNLFFWGALQFITGMCIACKYIIIESWLNLTAKSHIRARIFALYMICWFVGAGTGPLLLGSTQLLGASIFYGIAVMFLCAAIAVFSLLEGQPTEEAIVSMSVTKLFKQNSFGTLASFIVGISYGAVLGITAAYAYELGFSTKQISLFVSSFVCGGALAQYSLARYSDRYDRHNILLVCSLVAAVCTLLAGYIDEFILSCLSALLFGAAALPIYTLAVAYVQDDLQDRERVAASGGLLLMNGMGSFAGPLVIGLTSQFAGFNTLFVILGISFVSLSIIGLLSLKKKTGVLSLAAK